MFRLHLARALTSAAMLIVLGASAAPAQHPGTAYEGSAALGLSLRKLGVSKRVLMIGAHPDDESTQILAALALGAGADVAYLSLTRGEGGQNGIGPELQEGLGLLRTEELLAARRLDGARQFFTRAYDFGFSRSPDEAFAHWPREEILGDVVAVVRHFRPHLILSVFSGTPRDGHGHHQAAGILAREAFHAAADPARYPEHLAAGLRPHAPQRIYQALWRGGPGDGLALATGEMDPLLGRSHFQVAVASRSLHRSQDQGQIQGSGPQHSYLTPIASLPGLPHGEGLFAGIDTTLAAMATAALAIRTAGAAEDPIAPGLLAAYDERVARARDRYNPLRPEEIVADLVEALRALRLLEQDAELIPPATDLHFHLTNERGDAERALWLASGLVLDAVTTAETVTPGQQMEVEVTLWNGGVRPVHLRALELDLPEGWLAFPLGPPVADVAPGTLARRRFRVMVHRDADPTEPYFLQRDREGAMYRWREEAGPAGHPFHAGPVVGVAIVAIDGTPLRRELEAEFRGVDKVLGEFRRPLRVVPPLTVRVEPTLAVLPLADGHAPGEMRLAVLARSESNARATATLRLRAPAGWRVEPRMRPLAFAAAGEEKRVEFTLTPPPNIATGSVEVAAMLEGGGRVFSAGYTLVDYPHIDPRPLYREALTRVQGIDLRVPQGVRVGYIAGPGDDVPASLQQLGLAVSLIGPDQLPTADLSAFDVVVIGIRAYEVRPDLITHNQRVLDYARRGGVVIAQYNKYEYTDPGIAPYPVAMARPHDRITDEGAPVRLIDPEHRIFTTPNRIGPHDFDGWVQERGLYFLSEWDERFTPLLEITDPGQPTQRGGLLIAPYGDGVYVYTGLAFFRQLPAGVPGAWRLFTNLIALGDRR